jgi:hypothetical protein
MTFADDVDAAEGEIARIVRETAGYEFPKFWRKLGRPVTFFDLCSPRNFRERRSGRIL